MSFKNVSPKENSFTFESYIFLTGPAPSRGPLAVLVGDRCEQYKSHFNEMDDNTNWTPSPDDNKLDLTDKNLINEYDAKGIATGELFLFELDSETEISTQLLF